MHRNRFDLVPAFMALDVDVGIWKRIIVKALIVGYLNRLI